MATSIMLLATFLYMICLPAYSLLFNFAIRIADIRTYVYCAIDKNFILPSTHMRLFYLNLFTLLIKGPCNFSILVEYFVTWFQIVMFVCIKWLFGQMTLYSWMYPQILRIWITETLFQDKIQVLFSPNLLLYCVIGMFDWNIKPPIVMYFGPLLCFPAVI